jgi:hypothetical protein
MNPLLKLLLTLFLRLFLIMLPFCALGFGREYIGMIAFNGSLLPFVLVTGVYLLRPTLPIRTRTVQKAAVLFSVFLLLMWLSNLWMGVYYKHTLKVVQAGDPLKHSLSRAFIPGMLALITLFGFLMASQKYLGYAAVRKIMYWQFLALLGFGYFQASVLMFGNPFYEALANFLEAGRGKDLSYLATEGRLNLTTMEASEAGRLLVTFYIPMLFASISFKVLRQGRSSLPEIFALLLFLPVFVYAQSTNAIIALVIAIMLWIALDYRRFLIHGLIGVGLIVFVCCVVFSFKPEAFEEGYRRVVEKPMSIDDPSAQTRYAFFVAAWRASLDNPITGIGLGKGVYAYEAYFPHWGYNWETNEAFATGEAVGPKSLIMKLLSECGFPALLCYLLSFVYIGIAAVKAKNRYVRIYVPMSIVVYLVYATIDGGFGYTFYSWAVIGLWAVLCDQYGALSDDAFDVLVFAAGRPSSKPKPILYSDYRRRQDSRRLAELTGESGDSANESVAQDEDKNVELPDRAGA